VAVLLVSSLLSAAYFFPIVYRGFFAPASEETLAHTGEAPLLCLIPLSVTTLCSVGLFFYPDIFLQLVHRALFP
jgi:multicomponent Na+:H+ antiporter subunit D